MDIVEFLKTIYLGDRACKSFLIDGWNGEIKMQVTRISRVRGTTWDFYTAEDVEDGFIVFENVQSFVIEPAGPLPNDLINEIRAEPLVDEKARFRIILSVSSADDSAKYTELNIEIKADTMSLEDPKNPGVRIRE